LPKSNERLEYATCCAVISKYSYLVLVLTGSKSEGIGKRHHVCELGY